jgi:NitT/TauT family transport system permease protein
MSPGTGSRLWRRRPRLPGLDRIGPPLVLFALVVSGWHAATVLLGVPTVVLPSPLDVLGALGSSWETLLGDALVTGVTAALGLLGGIAVGVPLAFGMVRSRTVEAVARPYVIGLRVAPLVAVAPLVFLWFGRGIAARALLVTTLTLFPVTVASVGGLRSVPREYLDLARSVAAPDRTVFLRVRVPAAAPSVFAGVKLAATLSVIGAVVAEFVTLDAGLGYRVVVTSTDLRTAETYAALVVLAALGIAFYLAPVWLERRSAAAASDRS